MPEVGSVVAECCIYTEVRSVQRRTCPYSGFTVFCSVYRLYCSQHLSFFARALKDVKLVRVRIIIIFITIRIFYLRALFAAAADAIARRMAPLLMAASLSLDDEFESKTTGARHVLRLIQIATGDLLEIAIAFDCCISTCVHTYILSNHPHITNCAPTAEISQFAAIYSAALTSRDAQAHCPQGPACSLNVAPIAQKPRLTLVRCRQQQHARV